MLMIAAVASVTAVGSKSYLKGILLRSLPGRQAQGLVINVEDMDTQESESADETQVYRKIRKLDLKVVRMEV